MIDPMNDAEVERMARAIYEELVANRHWDDVPLGDRDDFVHLLRRAMLSARPALSEGPNHIGDANEMVPALSTESGWRDIATAPRNGTTVDLWAAERERYQNSRIPDCVFFKGQWMHGQTIFDDDTTDGTGLVQVFNATHWMPLPNPPTETER